MEPLPHGLSRPQPRAFSPQIGYETLLPILRVAFDASPHEIQKADGILRRSPPRARYDAALRKSMSAQGAPAGAGGARFDEHAVAAKPTFAQRTLYMIARNPKVKQYAAKADRFLSNGQLEEARIQIISAYQQDPRNDELKERLDILYEALALEPGERGF